nr:hypothetical protein [Tanacetum cinerariifolium]
MASLADKAILSGADNRPPMLENDMYDSWKSRMELMILESVEQGPLIWPFMEVEGVTRLKKYSKLSAAEAIQADFEVLKELPKVSMVNSCLKKLKFHLASFDIVVKERTTATAITEGTWGFEHTKACFRDDIIPFVKNLKELFTSFDQYLIDEVSEVQKIFKQMEMAVEQNCAEKTKFQTKMANVLKENDHLFTHALGVEIVNIVVNDCMNVNCLTVNA